jgi:hypothetical protein
MVMVRDQNIINFLDEDGFHAATAKQIHKLFFTTSPRYTRKRLQYLTDNLCLKRTRSTIDNSFAYYVQYKPVQLHHDLIRTELYTAMVKMYKILEWHNEAPVSNIRPDALCYIEHSGIVFPVMVEIHLINKFDFDKYKIDFKPILGGVSPRVLICTDRQVTIPRSTVRFKVVGVNMFGLDSLLK